MDWETIVTRHGEQLFRAAFRILHDAADSEDVTQEVLCEAFRMSQRDGQVPDLALIRRMATLRAIDRLRRRHAERSLHNLEPCSTDEGPNERMQRKEDGARLRLAIADLTSRQAACFALRYLDGMSHREIAETLGISESNVSSTLNRARRQLRQSLQTLSAEPQ